MSKSTISTFKLFEIFPTANRRGSIWNLGSGRTARSARTARASASASSPRSASIAAMPALRFHDPYRHDLRAQPIPLHKWLYAMYLLVTARKGISSMQLAKEIGVTQKSAWFMLQRLREACGWRRHRQVRGIVEIDECFIGGKERNKHEHKKLQLDAAPSARRPSWTWERGGRTVAMPIEATDMAALQSAVHANVEVGSTIFTDEATGYVGLDGLFFRHEAINHTAGIYSENGVSTNSIESVWAVLKRGVYGVYHQVSRSTCIAMWMSSRFGLTSAT